MFKINIIISDGFSAIDFSLRVTTLSEQKYILIGRHETEQ